MSVAEPRSMYPLPPNWEMKYDPNTKRNYFVDHEKKRATWTDPRPKYYGNNSRTNSDVNVERPSAKASVGSELSSEVLESIHIQPTKEPSTASFTSKTSAVVSNFISSSYNPKHDSLSRSQKQPHKSSRKTRKPSVGSPSIPSSSSHRSQKGRRLPSRHCTSSESELKGDYYLQEDNADKTQNSEIEELKSFPESEEATNALSDQDRDSTEKSANQSQVTKVDDPNVTDSEALDEGSLTQNTTSRNEVRQGCRLNQAKGHNPDLLTKRTPAKGPDPSLRRGPDPSLPRGPNPDLLRKNQSGKLVRADPLCSVLVQ